MSFSLDPTAPLSSDNPQRGAGQINAIAQAVAQLFGLNTGVPIQNGTSPFALSSDGRVTLVADPTAALGAATKRYVDAIGGAGSAAAALTAAAAAQKTADAAVIRNGDTMTGPLVLSGNPTVALGAATKEYVSSVLGVSYARVALANDLTLSVHTSPTTILTLNVTLDDAFPVYNLFAHWGVFTTGGPRNQVLAAYVTDGAAQWAGGALASVGDNDADHAGNGSGISTATYAGGSTKTISLIAGFTGGSAPVAKSSYPTGLPFTLAPTWLQVYAAPTV